MFVLFVDMHIKPGTEPALAKTYNETFRPAISGQDGFSGLELLRLNPGQDNHSGEYRLSIAFETHALQQKWVATDLHQEVWPQMEGYCAQYSIARYTSI